MQAVDTGHGVWYNYGVEHSGGDGMGKVYVTQETTHNYIEAERFGEVVFLSRMDLNNTKGSLHNEAVLRSLRVTLRNFDPQNDYIVPSGSPYITAAVFHILGSLGHKHIRVLRWNNRDLNYQVLYLDFARIN